MVTNDEYKSPSTEVLRLIRTADDDVDNNRDLLEAITEITGEYRLNDEVYEAIIALLSSEPFLETFEGETDELEEFISNFTHFTGDRTSPVPKIVIKKALKKWRKVKMLEDIIRDEE